MIRTAIILTVYNRKQTTLSGLTSLYKAIEQLPEGKYTFDIYMTDDGSIDGTSDAVKEQFPAIHIIKGDGSLYWSGGMRKAWQAAIDTGIKYDFYLWFNDDAVLFENALVIIFKASSEIGDETIISGAFCDDNGKVSYGGFTREKKLITPTEDNPSVFFMNGNLVLISKKIFKKIGMIDNVFHHSFGDWDYGCRAIKKGYSVRLSNNYVGITNRHDGDTEPFLNSSLPLHKRLSLLYSRKYSTYCSYVFCKRHIGIVKAIRVLVAHHLYTFFPSIYKYTHGV